MIPIILPLMSNGAYSDPRPHCKCCGQVLPKASGFRKWLSNSYGGIVLSTIGVLFPLIYIGFTVMGWLVCGSFGGTGYNNEHSTLLQYTLDQWSWIGQKLHQLW